VNVFPKETMLPFCKPGIAGTGTYIPGVYLRWCRSPAFPVPGPTELPDAQGRGHVPPLLQMARHGAPWV